MYSNPSESGRELMYMYLQMISKNSKFSLFL